MDDERLLRLAETTLTQIKVAQGLSEHHESVLAAIRIRLKGSAGKSLEEMLDAVDEPAPDNLDDRFTEVARPPRPSLDDLLGKEPPPKRDWPT